MALICPTGKIDRIANFSTETCAENIAIGSPIESLTLEVTVIKKSQLSLLDWASMDLQVILARPFLNMFLDSAAYTLVAGTVHIGRLMELA